MSVSVEAHWKGFHLARKRLLKLADVERTEFLDAVGALGENQTRDRIANQEGPPEGGDWLEYTPAYEKWKKKKKGRDVGFLKLEGHLVEDLTHNVFSDSIEIGSNAIYAEPNQELRPFIGLSDANRDELEEFIVDFLGDNL